MYFLIMALVTVLVMVLVLTRVLLLVRFRVRVARQLQGGQVDDQGQGMGLEMFGRALFGPLPPLTH